MIYLILFILFIFLISFLLWENGIQSPVNWEKVKDFLPKDSISIQQNLVKDAQRGDSLALQQISYELMDELKTAKHNEIRNELRKFPYLISISVAKHNEKEERFGLISIGYLHAIALGEIRIAKSLISRLEYTPQPTFPMFINDNLKNSTSFNEYMLKLTQDGKDLYEEIKKYEYKDF